MAMTPLGIALSMQPPADQASKPAVAPTDVIGAYKLATDAANTQYLAKLQQQNAMWGGLAGLGSAGMLAAPRIYSSGMLQGLFAPSAGAGAAGLAGDAPALAGAAGLAGDVGAAGSIAGDMAAAAPAVADAGSAAAFSLADLLPFIFAA